MRSGCSWCYFCPKRTARCIVYRVMINVSFPSHKRKMEPPPEYFGDAGSRRRPNSRGAVSDDDVTQPAAPSMGTAMQGQLGQMVWEAGSRQVKEAFVSYGRIDLFRPYFDVDPKQVRNRLLQSLIPRKPSQMQTATDLYGPLMLILTLIALLLLTMKTSDYKVQDGTLIGTAFFTCFAYWIFASAAVYAMCYVFTSDVTLLHTFSLLGYALFGHCVVVFLTAVFHPLHSHLFFYSLLLLFGGCSCLRMAIFLASKTRDKTHKLILGCTVSFLHLAFLMYLHFGFHTFVEEMDEILGTHHAMAPQQLFTQKTPMAIDDNTVSKF